MRVFVSNIDGYLGNAFLNVLPSDIQIDLVGTVSEGFEHEKKHIFEPVKKGDLAGIKAAIWRSEVIIYNIVEDYEGAKFVIQELMDAKLEEEKVFICVSNVLTWAKTPLPSGDSEDQPFAEEDYRKRKAHQNYKEHLLLEKLTLRLKKQELRTYVVCSGLLYGNGENWLHFLFKKGWYGESLPCVGDGQNIIPTIHVQDLAKVLREIMFTKPNEDRYFLAVDASNVSMIEIVKAISNQLGSGAIHFVTEEEALLIEDFKQEQLDISSINLRTEPVAINELNLSWKCENGLVENISSIVQEFRNSRAITPIRMAIHGPPASGKSQLCKLLCTYYEIHHIHIPTIMQEEIKLHSDLGKELESLNETSTGEIPDSVLLELVKSRLTSWKCQNQGFILDDFPKTTQQAQALFTEDTESGKEFAEFFPEFVISMEASNDFLRTRVMNMKECEVMPGHNDEQGFTRRLQQFREQNTEANTVLNFYEDKEELVILYLKSERNLEELVLEVQKIIGKPRNYGPKAEEIEARRKILAQQEAERQQKQKAIKEELEQQENAQRKKLENEWAIRLDRLQQEERSVLELQSAPFRTYLMETVMLVLTSALIETCKIHPEDPIDYLAEYLFKHSSDTTAEKE